MIRSLSTLAWIALLALPQAGSGELVDPVKAEVKTGQPGVTISRHLFGQFAEHLGHGIYGGVWVGPNSAIPNTRGIRNDVVAALRTLKVPNVRWPGGCFADYYHWRDGIGAERPVTLNPDWGSVTESNAFGTHEFMDFAAQIGAEPFVSVNVGSGSPREAAEWMEYMTAGLPTTLAQERAANGRDDPWRIPFLGLGNESWDCGGNMSPDTYVEEMKRYARFARNYHPQQQSEDKMQRIAVGPGGGEPRFLAWTEAVMKAWKDRQWSWDIEGLSLHHYTVIDWNKKHVATGFGTREYAEILHATLQMDGLIAQHTAIMDRYDPERKLLLAVDEWGAWYAPATGTNPGFLMQQNSLRDGLLAALNLNIFARRSERVRMANIAQMVNVLQAMILTQDERMLLTPTYHVFRMYVPFQQASLLPLRIDAGRWNEGDLELPHVDGIAARAVDGQVLLALTNLHPHREAPLDIEIDDDTLRSVAAETLSAPAVDSVNTFEAPETVAPRALAATRVGTKLQVVLPPRSVSVIRLGAVAP